MPQDDLERRSIDTIRVLAMDSVQKANAGHPGTAMALAPVAYLLYTELMRHNPANPAWPDRDRFVLSAGHACILQYATLHLAGYDLTLDDLKQFRQWGSRTPGHPEHFLTPGVETTTGPLGQGVANGVGFGVAERFLAQRYNRPHHEIVDHRVYAICSDGDLMEGVASEACSIAGHLGLGKLIYLYDDNRITIDGTTALSFSVEDKGKRFEAYGWHVQHVQDVNDLDEVRAAYKAAEDESERPSLIVAHTHIAYPAPHAIDTAKAHGSPLGEDEVRATKEVLGWDPDKHFVVPDGVHEHGMGSIVNGLALHGGIVKPYGSTFLVFSDYMRPAVRLSALTHLPVVWAWTHDSIGLGEDGPTHQPVEHYAALRAIPNLWFIRPADANETVYAWKLALRREDGPVALSLSRQKVATLDRSDLAPASGVERGAYV